MALFKKQQPARPEVFALIRAELKRHDEVVEELLNYVEEEESSEREN